MVDKSYACRNYYPFQTVAMEENDLFDLAAVRQNAGFEDRALSECGFFYQSYAVGNNYVLTLRAENAASPIVVTEPSFGILLLLPPAMRVFVFLYETIPFPAVNFVSSFYGNFFQSVAARKSGRFNVCRC